jgi:hypothetical protein
VDILAVKFSPVVVNRTAVVDLIANRYYDIFLQYVGSSSPLTSLSLLLLGPDAAQISLGGSEFSYSHPIGERNSKSVYYFERPPVSAAELAQFTRVYGSGLSIATAGTVSLVSILVQDRFGLQTENNIVVRAVALNSMAVSVTVNPMVSSCTSCPVYVASVVNRVDRLYVAAFNFTRSGDYLVLPSVTQIGGLSATVYRDCDASALSKIAASWSHPAQCAAVLYSPAAFPAPISIQENSYPAVRYSGFFRSISEGQHLIGVKGSGKVSIWVRERQVVSSQQLSMLMPIEAPFQSDEAEAFTDILISHWQDESAPFSINLTLQSPSGALVVLSSSSLFAREDVIDAKSISPGTLSYQVTGIWDGVLQLQTGHSLAAEDPIILSGSVPDGLEAGVIYYVKDTIPLSESSLTLSAHTDQAMLLPSARIVNTLFTLTRINAQNLKVRPEQCCASQSKVMEGSLPKVQFCGIIYEVKLTLRDIYGNPCFQRDSTGQPLIGTLFSNDVSSYRVDLPIRYEGSSAILSYGPLTDSGLYRIDMYFTGPLTMLSEFPATFQVFGGSFCSTMSTIEGSGLSSVSIYASSAISIVNRDMFGNLAIGEFEGLFAEECLPDIVISSTSLVDGVAEAVTVSENACSCCKFVTPFPARGPLLWGTGFEVIPLFNSERLISLNAVNSGNGVGGSGYKYFPPLAVLGKPAVFVKVMYTSNLPVFETSSTPQDQSDDAADLTEFVSALPFFDKTLGRYVLLYRVQNMPSAGKSGVVSVYAGYHGALLATYYSLRFSQVATFDQFNVDLDGPMATPCLVAPALSSFQGIKVANSAASWVRPDELGCGRGTNATSVYGVRYSAWINSTKSDGVTLSFSPVPAGLYLRAIADTRNVKFLQTGSNTWDFQVGPVPELSAVIVPRFPYFHVFIELRFDASLWDQVPFPVFHNTSCSSSKGLNCGVYASYSLKPEHNIISIKNQAALDSDESEFSYAGISLSSNLRGTSVSLSASFTESSVSTSVSVRGIKQIWIAGLNFAAFSPSGDAVCYNTKNSMSVSSGGISNAAVKGRASSVLITFPIETFARDPGIPISCQIYGFSNPSSPVNSSNSVVISTYGVTGSCIQYKSFIEFPEIL